jgi:hypothetical protein
LSKSVNQELIHRVFVEQEPIGEVAVQLGLTPADAQAILATPAVQSQGRRLREQAEAALADPDAERTPESAIDDAFEVQLDILNDPTANPTARSAASRELRELIPLKAAQIASERQLGASQELKLVIQKMIQDLQAGKKPGEAPVE